MLLSDEIISDPEETKTKQGLSSRLLVEVKANIIKYMFVEIWTIYKLFWNSSIFTLNEILCKLYANSMRT